jgi:succinoglycan biosynthesis transport protein ExoP
MAMARSMMAGVPVVARARVGSGPVRFQFADFVRVIKTRHRLILGVAAACVAMTALVLMLVPTQYSGFAEVMLEQRKNNVADASSVLSSLPTDPASVQNQIQILTSRDLASRVVDRLGLENDPEFNRGGSSDAETLHERVVDTFLKHLNAWNEGLSTALSVSFSASTPEKAAQITNAVVDTYVQLQLETKSAATHEATNWLESRVRDLSRQVQAADSAVERYKAEHDLNESSGGVPLIEQQITALSTQLVQAQADLSQKDATLARVNMLMKSGQEADVSQVVSSPLIIQLRQQEADLNRSEADLETKYGPKHPKLIAVQSQKRDLEDKIAREVTRIGGSLSNDVSVARAQVGALGSGLDRAERQAQAQNLLRVKLKSLEVNAASTHSIYEAFVARLRGIQDQDLLQASDARVISHAAAPNAPSSPHRTLILGASLPAGLMLGLLMALVAEFVPPLSQTAAPDVLRGVPVLAEIPGVAHARAADLVIDWPASPFAQSISTLAYKVAYGAARGGPRAILVTSPQSGEGASTIAVSLARAAASLGRRVIVVDANLHAPSVAPLAGTRRAPSGLTDVLAGRAALSQTLIKDPRSGALLLSPAQPRRDPYRVLGSRQFAQLVSHLRHRCDLLLICAPPVLAQGGTNLLARYADAVMLVARADVGPRPAVSAAVNALARIPAPPIGIVLAS